MTKFVVNGIAEVMVLFEVEAETEEEAIEKAYEECDGLTAYCGNGGTDKLVGVNSSDVSIYPNLLEWYEAEKVC